LILLIKVQYPIKKVTGEIEYVHMAYQIIMFDLNLIGMWLIVFQFYKILVGTKLFVHLIKNKMSTFASYIKLRTLIKYDIWLKFIYSNSEFYLWK